MDFVPWRLCNTILADRVYNAAPGQVVLRWFHQARGTSGVEGVLTTATPADMGIYNKPEIVLAETPGTRQYNQRVVADQGWTWTLWRFVTPSWVHGVAAGRPSQK